MRSGSSTSQCRATLAAVLLLAFPAGADTTQLTAAPGTSGGTITGAGNIEAQTSTGDAIEGGVTTTGTIQDKGGYTGQLYDLVSLQLSATPTTVDEGAARQLDAITLLDDATTLTSTPIWSIVSGPLASIDANGLATADLVYQDTPATARADLLPLTETIDLTVLDTDPDNFGSYAGDGIDDDWQVNFFGLDNPDAAPGIDPDGDDQTNLYEFLAKVDPTDGTNFFTTCLERNQSDPSKRDIILNPVFGDRTYTLMVSPDLVPANFVPATNTTTSNNGSERTITHNSAIQTRQFYKIKISK